MSLKESTIKDQLKKIDYCQPMNEGSIEQDLHDILNVLVFLKAAERLDDAFFADPEKFSQPASKKFYMYELPFLACKYIIEFKQFTNQSNQQFSRMILQTSLLLSLNLLKQYPDSVLALETMRLILDPERHFYKFSQVVEQDDTRFVRQSKISQEQRDFCISIREKDYIDCLKQDTRSGTIDWSRGQVVKVSEKHVWVRWLGDELALNRKVQKESWDLAPFKSYVSDENWDWRFILQVDDRVDSPDDNVWYNSTVIERTEQTTDRSDKTPQVDYKIGFRFYDPNGNMLDPRNDKKYFGWSSQYDEDVNATNPRLQKLNRYSKNFCKYASMSYAEESIKDQSDFIYEYQQTGVIYAVPRFNTRNQRKSQLMIDLIQEFGQNGGFELFHNRISSTNPWCPIDVVHPMLVILGNIHEQLTRNFCYSYVPALWDHVQNNLLNSPDSNLRNFSSQKISECLNGLGLVLKRVYSLKEKAEMSDKIEMNISLKCFNSDFLERKLQGLKSIQDLMRKNKDFQMTMQNSDIKFLTTQIIVEWINENKIFEGLYVQNTNSHLIQRSSDFLKFMLDEHLVSSQHMEMVWASARRDETEQKLAVYKLLKDVSSSLSKEHLDYLVDRVCEKNALSLTKDDVELLSDLTRYNYRHKEEFCQKFCDFYWSLLTTKLPSPLDDQIVQFYIDQVTSFELRPHRQAYLSKIAEQIILCNGQLSIALRVLVKFIEKLEVQPLSWDNLTRNAALTEIEQKYSIINSVVKSLESLKAQSSQSQQAIYLEEVKTRMQFIQFFYSNITTVELRLSFSVISSLWDQLVCRSSCVEERDLLYRWFSSLASLGQSLTSIVTLEDLKSFFETKIASDFEQIRQLTPEGFNCFMAVFIALNVQLQNIRTQDRRVESQSPYQFNSIGQSKSNDSVKKRFDYDVLLDPLQLYGFNTLWTIVVDADSIAVCKQAIELLQDIYGNVQVEVNLLNFIFDEIERLKDEPRRLYRALLVLEETIDQSEVNGPGSLISLIALSSSELATINVLNDLNSGISVPKKITVTILENQPIIELRWAIAKQLRVPWDTVALSTTKGEVRFSENGKMVRDLRLKKGEAVVASRQYVREPPEKELLDSENNLTAAAIVVFQEIFDEYSAEGKMSKENCARYVTGCTGNPCSQEDPQISRTFEQYDRDKDGFLLASDFLEFYTEAARSKKSTVWQNLHMLSYRNDLVRGDQVSLPEVSSSTLPRGIITKSPAMMNVLFHLLDSKDVQLQEQAWHLLRRLPPSPSYFMKILQFQGISRPEDWDSVLSVHSNFRLLYSLHIIEYLMSNHSEGQSSFLAIIKEDDETIDCSPQVEMKDKWMSDFLQFGGFDRLFQFFKNYQERSVSLLDINEKEILSFLLKTFSMYLVAACALRISGAYQAAALIARQQITTEQVLLAIRSDDDENSPKQPHEFGALLEKLKDGLGESILNKFQLPEFVTVLKGIVDELLNQKTELESEDRGIIEFGIISIVIILLYDEQLAQRLMEQEEFLRTIYDGLYTEKSPNIRNLFARAVLVLCSQSQAINGESKVIKIVLSDLIEHLKDPSYNNSSQYYELLCSLIGVASQQENAAYIDYESFALQVVETLIEHNSQETRIKGTQVDGVLVGLLNLLSKIIETRPNIRDSLSLNHNLDLPNLIFSHCLFVLGDSLREIKCKSPESRAAAFQLLLTLCRDHQQSNLALVASLTSLSDRIPAVQKWNHVPSQDMRSPKGFVGIRNLGATCYMNAMLQQFYMTPEFRYGVLMSDDCEPEQFERRSHDGVMVDDNILHQLQKMFAYLELSDRVDYNPHEFCFAYKDFTGEPVNLLIQQDAQEFMNMMFDKIETAIKPTPFKYLLDGVYGGKTCTQLVCQQCQNVRNKEEQFYNLSIPIKNLKNIHECFEKYIQGETISDFKCEECNQKVDVVKRQLLSQLPNVLILHLQRIVFNLDTLMNEKINHRVEFPMELDLKQYTIYNEDSNATECTEYQLAGVVVHFGTAEYGHYFSFIDIKRSEKDLMQKPEAWLEFNDNKIKEFKTKQIEKESFGGTTSDQSLEDEMWGWNNKFNRDNSQNAYMLVYEKKVKQPVHLEFQSEQHLLEAQQKYNLPPPLSVSHSDGKVKVLLRYYDLVPYVPEKLRNQVMGDNQQFLLERNLYDTELQQFILSSISMLGLSEGKCVLQEQGRDIALGTSQLLTSMSFDLLARTSDNKLLETFVSLLKSLLEASPEASLDFLNNFFLCNIQKTVDLLLVCPELKTRNMFAKLLASAFNTVIDAYKIDLVLEEQNEDNIFDEEVELNEDLTNYKIVRGLKTMFLLLQDQVAKNWVRLESYFTFWFDFMNGGEKQMAFMMRNQCLSYLIDFILEKQSPLQLYEKKHSMGNSYFSVNYESIFLVINELIQQILQNKYSFDSNDIKLIYNFRFYDKVLKKINSPNVINNLCGLIVSFAKNKMYFSEIICGCLLRGINRADQDEMNQYLQVLEQLVMLDDGIKPMRIEWLIGVPQMQNHSNRYISGSKELYNFGTFGMQSLEEDVMHFTSPLGWQSTLLDYIVQHRSTKGNDSQCLLAIKCLLKLTLEDQQIFEFVHSLPSTNFIFRSFDDLLENFIVNYISDSKRYYYHTYPRDLEAAATQKLLESYKERIALIPRQICDYIIGKSVTVTVIKRYLYAIDLRTQKTIAIDESTPEGLSQSALLLSDPLIEKVCVLEDKIFKTYICDNLPTGQTNEALPSAYVKGSQFFTYSVAANTMASNFIQPKVWTSAHYNDDDVKEENQEKFDCFLDFQILLESDLTESQMIRNPRLNECVRQISVQSHIFKHIQAIVSIIDPEGQAPHYVPHSPIQSMIQPNGTAFMFTTKKWQSVGVFTKLEFKCEFNQMENDHSHLYLTNPESRELELQVLD